MTTRLVSADAERCYRAVRSRDARFDGVFFTGVRTTGIYCRPSCPAVTPKQTNVVFFATAAAAHGAGFRACRRCRPDTTPGSPDWNVRADAVGRAMRLIRDGVVERDGVGGLASRLGYSRRHVQRLLHTELGAGPLALARAQRAHIARTLIETTRLPFADVAFAAGFASVRQFNDTMREIYARSPQQMRALRATCGTDASGHGRLRLRLAVRQPFDTEAAAEFLAVRAVAGLEHCDGMTYVRALRLPHGDGRVQLQLHDGHVDCQLDLDDLRDLAGAVQRCRSLLDLDADPDAITEVLGADPALAPLVSARPGLRVLGHVDGFELAVRAVAGQQVTVARARTVLADLVRRYGRPLSTDYGNDPARVTSVFPTPETLAEADPTALGMPAARGRAVVALSEAVAAHEFDLEPGADREATVAELRRLPGVGPWTAGYIAMRALADPDVYLEGDVVVRKSMSRLGLPSSAGTAAKHAYTWRPWRSYAVMHLWRHASDRAAPVSRPVPPVEEGRS
ncbi:MAG: DNA-3-methyladenine glycosylase 2 family protein [Nocardioidaceae bacterium]|nr:DNA-3-methyladenine glycosylase 2 family protein [Nocardioidaceae bacterium]